MKSIRYTAATILLSTSLSLPLVALASVGSTDRFVKGASIGGEFEVESSQVALQKSQNDNVKSLAQMLIDDHTKANTELKEKAVATKNDKAVVEKLDDKHQKMLDKLNKADAKDFDAEYLKAQGDAHKEAIALFKDYAKSGSNADLKTFAGDTLPTLEEHAKKVAELKK